MGTYPSTSTICEWSLFGETSGNSCRHFVSSVEIHSPKIEYMKLRMLLSSLLLSGSFCLLAQDFPYEVSVITRPYEPLTDATERHDRHDARPQADPHR